MKKFFKALALVLALALVIGVVPAQATSAKIKAKKTLYVDGAKGTSTDGKLKSGYKARVAIYKLAGDTKTTKEGHTYKAVIKSGDSVTVTKKYVKADNLGKTVVEIFKDGESLGTSAITVRKNATADTLTITGFEDGQEVVCGVKTTVTLPRYGVDSDERRLFVDDKEVTEVEGMPRTYEVTFKKSGDHKIRFEAFQGGDLDAVTTPAKEITVKALMPKPVSAKQVSASSFSVEFEGDMTDLITKDDITNQMIYYLIASEPVVTGVVKDVKVEGKEVIVTMHADFNSATEYFFKYGECDAVSFTTAKNELKYVDHITVEVSKAIVEATDNKITVKYFNADGVELNVEGYPTITVDSDVAWLDGGNLYFYKEGVATVKASVLTGEYEPETYKAIEVTASITVEGTKAVVTLSDKTYSFTADYKDAKHFIRKGDVAPVSVLYKFSDKDRVLSADPAADYVIKSAATSDTFYLKSTDETIVMIDSVSGTDVLGVNEGKATIVVYDANGTTDTSDDKVYDAFSIEVKPANKGNMANITLSANSKNLDPCSAEEVVLTVDARDLDNVEYDNYNIVVKQVENNEKAVGATITKIDHAAYGSGLGGNDFQLTFGVSTTYAAKFVNDHASVSFVVEVYEGTNTSNPFATKTFTVVVADTNEVTGYKINATKASLDTSLKAYGDGSDPSKNPAKSSEITVQKVNTKFGVVIDCGKYTGWEFVTDNDFSNIPTTGTAAKVYLRYAYPYGSTAAPATFVKVVPGDTITINNFDVANPVTVPDEVAKSGTYSITGYYVEYDGGTQKLTKKSNIGSASVVVSANNVDPVVVVKDGKQATLTTALATNDNTALKDVFTVTWDGKNNDKNPDFIEVQPLVEGIHYEIDSTTGAYFVKEITVVMYPYPGYAFETELKVNKLFKDK